MKIINDTIWWESVCVACGATCQAEPNDVTSRPNVDCDGDEVGRIPVVECGKCGKQHDVPDEKITEKIMKIARRKGRHTDEDY